MKPTPLRSALLAATFSLALSSIGLAQTAVTQTTTSTTSAGTITQFQPSETVVIRSESNPEPIRYSVTKETTYVDESGNPVSVERVTSGAPVNVEYLREGDRMVASRIVVHSSPAAIEKRTTTTTTTSTPDPNLDANGRPLNHDERKALEKLHKAEDKRAEKEEKEIRKAERRD